MPHPWLLPAFILGLAMDYRDFNFLDFHFARVLISSQGADSLRSLDRCQINPRSKVRLTWPLLIITPHLQVTTGLVVKPGVTS